MAFIYPKKPSFDVPEGNYSATVHSAFERNTGLRIVFNITSLQHQLYTYKAGKDYAQGDQALTNDLIGWLGEDKVAELVLPDQSIDFTKLNGLKADIRIDHWHNDDYVRPYVRVCCIKPPGTLVRE